MGSTGNTRASTNPTTLIRQADKVVEAERLTTGNIKDANKLLDDMKRLQRTGRVSPEFNDKVKQLEDVLKDFSK